MNRTRLRQVSIVLAILGLLVPGHLTAFSIARQQPSVIAPRLVGAVTVPVQGAVLVTGQDFTPGGRVYIALYDRWGVQLFETRWATASDELFGLNGTRDPAIGYVTGGGLSEQFLLDDFAYGPNGSRDPAMIDVLDSADTEQAITVCTATLMVRALDEERNVWSNTLDVESGC